MGRASSAATMRDVAAKLALLDWYSCYEKTEVLYKNTWMQGQSV